MNTGDKSLAVVGYVLAMLVVFRVAPRGAVLMLLGLLAFAYVVTHDDRSR
ncbi:MAG: hypothetical protein GXP29_01955 [Planctomycetes bacterium]|nr:hypothetical protein [Planctomycetota bacterium]